MRFPSGGIRRLRAIANSGFLIRKNENTQICPDGKQLYFQQPF